MFKTTANKGILEILTKKITKMFAYSRFCLYLCSSNPTGSDCRHRRNIKASAQDRQISLQQDFQHVAGGFVFMTIPFAGSDG